MELKKTKQPIMGLAALLIIFFHLFPISRSTDLVSGFFRYIAMTAYIGVDIFFFMAGYMSAFSDTKNYLKYVKKKFINLYPIFLVSCIAVAAFGKLSVKQTVMTLIGVELIKRGGGSFLWFIPAIMMYYLVAPIYIRLVKKIGGINAFTVGTVAWAAIMIGLEYAIDNHNVNIFLCRIPIILIGVLASQYEGKIKPEQKIITSAILLITGVFLTWKFGYMIKANFLVTNIFYVLAMPYTVGVLLVADTLLSKYKLSALDFLGKISLELYCFQMILGMLLFGAIASTVKNLMLSFFIVVIMIIVLSHFAGILRKKLIDITKI